MLNIKAPVRVPAAPVGPALGGGVELGTPPSPPFRPWAPPKGCLQLFPMRMATDFRLG